MAVLLRRKVNRVRSLRSALVQWIAPALRNAEIALIVVFAVLNVNHSIRVATAQLETSENRRSPK